MIVFDSPDGFSQLHPKCVATIGKFDGVHLGHQLILDQLKQKAEQYNLPAVVIVLEPHPEEFFAGGTGNCPARLTTAREKLALLESYGIEFVFQLRFDQALSELSAESWVQDVLVAGLGISCLIIGHDFRFGHARSGDFALLQTLGGQLGFEVVETAACELDGQRISSTVIRERLSAADFALVEQYLGRPYAITGEVQRGQQLGTELGFPTCNISLQRRNIPLHGIYACVVRLGEQCHQAAVSIGYRPTVTEAGEALLEAHILDFDADLYGKTLEVIFKAKLRDEVKFDSLAALKEQMHRDVEQTREVLAANT